MKKFLIWGSVVLGVVLIVLTVVYFITPANALPHFFPGFQADITRTHYKHGIGTLILALALFAFAWFKSAPKKN